MTICRQHNRLSTKWFLKLTVPNPFYGMAIGALSRVPYFLTNRHLRMSEALQPKLKFSQPRNSHYTTCGFIFLLEKVYGANMMM
jgi:hypothetical protein